MCSRPGARLVLIVDDDLAIREALGDVLRDEGYEVLIAADGQDALDKLRQSGEAPCIILLDLMMPIMTGSQFYAEQQRDPSLRDIPVVVISADGNLRQKAQPFGGRYLAKPVKVDAVLNVVEQNCA
jgi:CheY-like chemotaxis protein